MCSPDQTRTTVWKPPLTNPRVLPHHMHWPLPQTNETLKASLMWLSCSTMGHTPSTAGREEKSVHEHHRKKIFWGTFLASKKNFPGRWWIREPYKNQEPPKSFLCGTHFFLQSSALEQGGVCFLFPRAGTLRRKFQKKSGKTPETLSELFLQDPSRVRLGSPNAYSSRHLKAPEQFQNSLPPVRQGTFFCCSEVILSKPVMEFPAVLGGGHSDTRNFTIFGLFLVIPAL